VGKLSTNFGNADDACPALTLTGNFDAQFACRRDDRSPLSASERRRLEKFGCRQSIALKAEQPSVELQNDRQRGPNGLTYRVGGEKIDGYLFYLPHRQFGHGLT